MSRRGHVTKRLRKGAAPDRLRAFFDANPGEELTFADIQAKLDVGVTVARDAFYRLRDMGQLEYVQIIRKKQ